MPTDKKSFMFYLDYKEHLSLLKKTEVGDVIMALINYAESGEIPDLKGASRMAFSFIKCQMDRDSEKYAKKCKTNQENGARGGRPSDKNKSEKEGEKPKITERLNEEPKKPDTDTDTDTDTDIKSSGGGNADAREKQDNDMRLVVEAYEQDIGTISGTISEVLFDYYKQGLSADLIIQAIKEAAKQNKRNCKYIEAILRNLYTEGVTTLAGWNERERKKAESAAGSTGPNKSESFNDMLKGVTT